MVVVAIVGILAALGVAGIRSHLTKSRSGEAMSMIQAIRAAQERYRAESGAYLDVSGTGLSDTIWFPEGRTPDASRVAWGAAAPTVTSSRWALLGVRAPGEGIRFIYMTRAGPAGTLVNDKVRFARTETATAFTTVPTQDWYVVEARGDTDGDGEEIYFVASSFSPDLVTLGSD